ncbi:hypothetical protein CYMTET_31571, partial [Cymbomonas tetramitiformis]
ENHSSESSTSPPPSASSTSPPPPSASSNHTAAQIRSYQVEVCPEGHLCAAGTVAITNQTSCQIYTTKLLAAATNEEVADDAPSGYYCAEGAAARISILSLVPDI